MKAKRRGNGWGTIKHLASGRWEATVMIGYYPNGKRRRKTVTARTKSEAEKRARAIRANYEEGQYSDASTWTFGQLIDKYLEHQTVGVKPTTEKAYRYAAARLKPLYGIKLVKLRLLHVDELSIKLQKEGLADSHVHRIMGTCMSALRKGRAWGVISVDWADQISRPRIPDPTPTGYTGDEVLRFLEAAKSHRLYAMYHLAFMAGLRRGELLGLHWDDVVFKASGGADVYVRRNVVQPGKEIIVHEPKTAASKRRIPVGADTANALKEHKGRQVGERGSAWEWHDPDIVFASETGRYLNTWCVYPPIKSFCKAAGIPYDGLHVFRRTSGSLLARNGADPKGLSKRLGHTNVGFTLRTYQHVYEDHYDGLMLSIEDLTPVIEPAAANKVRAQLQENSR